MNGKTIYHVCFGNNEHYYFGSIAAIYDKFSPEQIGVSLSRLWSFGVSSEKPYRNKKCIIYKGTIQRKKGNRNVRRDNR